MGGGAFHSLRWSFLTLSVSAVARPATNGPPGAPGGLEAGSFSPIFCPLHLCTFCTLLVTGLSQSRDCHPGGQWGKYSHYRMILYLETEKIILLFSYCKLNTNQHLHTYTHTHSQSGQRGGHRRLLLRAGAGGGCNAFISLWFRQRILPRAASLPTLHLVLDMPPAVGEFPFQEPTTPKERNYPSAPKTRTRAKFLGTLNAAR